tara:strand:+ start:358 stop:636 length:279 start_codon:yes stop_codon:yes gene_type:complete
MQSQLKSTFTASVLCLLATTAVAFERSDETQSTRLMTVSSKLCTDEVGVFILEEKGHQFMRTAQSQGFGTSTLYACQYGTTTGYCFSVSFPC